MHKFPLLYIMAPLYYLALCGEPGLAGPDVVELASAAAGQRPQHLHHPTKRPRHRAHLNQQQQHARHQQQANLKLHCS